MPASPHIAVIGAGIVGSAIAWALAEAGARVSLIDKGGPRATDASFAWINATRGNPPDYVRLRLAAMGRWRALRLPGLAPRWSGSLSWAVGGPALDAFVTEHAALGYPIRLMELEEIRAVEPALAEPPERAAFAPEEGIVAPVAAADALRRAAHAAGVEPVAAEVGGIASGRVALRTGGTIEADHVVIAAGTGAAALAPLPVSGVPGLLARTRPVPVRLDRILVTPEMILAQEPDGALLVAGEAGGSDPGTDPDGVARALGAAAAQLLGLGGVAIAAHRVGLRPMPRDGLPLIGPIPRMGCAYAAVMHSGVTLAPAVADLAAREILEGGNDPLLAPFRPDRFDL